jgi:hypothetical protein
MSLRDMPEGSSPPQVESSIDLICDDEDEDRFAGPRLLETVVYTWHRFLVSLGHSRLVSSLSRRRLASNPVSYHHLDQEQMVAYLDGELSITRTEEVGAHLQSCWSCRSEMRVIRTQIKTFLADRDAKLPDSSSASVDRIGELRRKLTDNDK